MTQHNAAPRAESTHNRLYEFAKAAITKIFVHPYASVCVCPKILDVFVNLHVFMYAIGWLVVALWRCVSCTAAEELTRTSGTNTKSVITLELVYHFIVLFCFVFGRWFLAECELMAVTDFIAFVRCFNVWNKPEKRSMGEPEEDLHCWLLWARPQHGQRLFSHWKIRLLGCLNWVFLLCMILSV